MEVTGIFSTSFATFQELLSFGFMQRAFLAGLVIGVVAPLIGMFLVVRRFSLLADTLAHVSFLGVVIASLTNMNPILTAIGTSVVASLSMEQVRKAKTMFGESVLALFLSGSLAIASVLLSFSKGAQASVSSILFGSISTVSEADLVVVFAAGCLVIAAIMVSYKQLFLLSLDEEIAHASGIPTNFYNQLLTVLSAVTVSVTLRIIGVLLVGALMVIPVMTALLFRQSFKRTLLFSILISLFCVFTGIVAAFFLGTPSGGTIVIIALLIFGGCFLFKR